VGDRNKLDPVLRRPTDVEVKQELIVEEALELSTTTISKAG
jgi:hypothetical protein